MRDHWATGPRDLWFSAALGARLGEKAMAWNGIGGGDIGRKGGDEVNLAGDVRNGNAIGDDGDNHGCLGIPG